MQGILYNNPEERLIITQRLIGTGLDMRVELVFNNATLLQLIHFSMLALSSQLTYTRTTPYLQLKVGSSAAFGHATTPNDRPFSAKSLLKQVGLCVGVSGLGHYFLGEHAHNLAEHLTLLPHCIGHIISDSAVCCGIPTGIVETAIEKRPEKDFKKRGVGFFKSLGKNIAKNFALSTSGHVALGVPADMAADGLQAATKVGPKIATALSEAALCCGIPNTFLETKKTWFPKRWLKKATVQKSKIPLNIEA